MVRVATGVCHSPTEIIMGLGFKFLLINCQYQLGVVATLDPQSHMVVTG